jgi:predicted  nucleic acid-binding Zn-ribbon protein
MYKTSYNRDVNKKLDLQGDVEKLQWEIKELNSQKSNLRYELKSLEKSKEEYLAERYKEREKETLLLEDYEEEIKRLAYRLSELDEIKGGRMVSFSQSYYEELRAVKTRLKELQEKFSRVSIPIGELSRYSNFCITGKILKMSHKIDELTKEREKEDAKLRWQQKELRETEQKYKKVIHQDRETILRWTIVGAILGALLTGLLT